MLLRGHMQNAYATDDLDKAMEIVGNESCVEKFDRFDPDMILRAPQGDEPLSVRVASFRSGGLNIEMIQPVCGWVAPYVSVLPADSSDAVPRFHHVSLRRDDEAGWARKSRRWEYPWLAKGQFRSRTRSRVLSSSSSMHERRWATSSGSPGKVPKPGNTSAGPRGGRSTDRRADGTPDAPMEISDVFG